MRQSELNSKKSIVSPSTVAKTHLTNQSFIFEKLVSKRDNQACFAESDPTLPAPSHCQKRKKKAAGKVRLEMEKGRGMWRGQWDSAKWYTRGVWQTVSWIYSTGKSIPVFFRKLMK